MILLQLGEIRVELFLKGRPGVLVEDPLLVPLEDLLEALQLSHRDVLVNHKIDHCLFAVLVP